jgi:hypothetical protein
MCALQEGRKSHLARVVVARSADEAAQEGQLERADVSVGDDGEPREPGEVAGGVGLRKRERYHKIRGNL